MGDITPDKGEPLSEDESAGEYVRKALELIPEIDTEGKTEEDISNDVLLEDLPTLGVGEYDLLLSKLSEIVMDEGGVFGGVILSNTYEMEQYLNKALSEIKADIVEEYAEELDPPNSGEIIGDEIDTTDFGSILDELGIDDSRLEEELSDKLDKENFEPSPNRYAFYFPLNIRSDKHIPDAVKIGVTEDEYEDLLDDGTNVAEVVKEEVWKDKRDVAKEDPGDPLVSYLDESEEPDKSDESSDIWAERRFNNRLFWRYKIEARSQEEAINKFRNRIDILLGKLNYIVGIGLSETSYEDSSDGKGGEDSRVEYPPVYIISEEEGEKEEYRGFCIESYEDKTTVAARGGAKQRKDHVSDFDMVTSVDEELNNGEDQIEWAFRAYNLGLSERDTMDRFFKFWQALETLLLIGRYESDRVIFRTLPIMKLISENNVSPPSSEMYEEVSPETRFEIDFSSRNRYQYYFSRTFELKKKRNEIAHGGRDPDVLTKDVNLLRTVWETVLPKMSEMYAKEETDHLKYILDRGYKDPEQIESALDDIQREYEKSETKYEGITRAKEWHSEKFGT
jgi:hypothetical protein